MTSDGHEIAERLVRELFPLARAAWLGGSTVDGTATATSDLDITVLLDGPPAPYRESLHYNGWPVELFVHTDAAMEYFFTRETERRRPNTLRLVGESLLLLDHDGSGGRLRELSRRRLAAGPKPLSGRELRAARYGLTDLLDDLIGADHADERLLIATYLWHQAADLLLVGHRRWTARGKRLQRELAAFDREHGTEYARELAHAVRSVAAGADEPMIAVVTRVLDRFGGRLFDGYRAAGPPVDAARVVRTDHDD
ncbi:nucleotidyltransferase domain-containing protein [Nocardia sp. CDC159]|uniref:Nucleotidyltransferase domain-containing protein n=1 Tax=Nocardia pulmonis TaxID=2951408 RepID=A0A9X2E4M0_9NOCA|nr:MULTISPECIES: nucleotidyltransferase domain-containing protein [Nocardia]MCM6773734.1 nucleotidyltransferase domain-containing protein [Nocardia pulmonis]MCM6786621.1 nucleotidyltransferase domain-containing protein [Nocardia sp. CDC159]